jgi:thiol-disulfide isomerase/thioredoxin
MSMQCLLLTTDQILMYLLAVLLVILVIYTVVFYVRVIYHPTKKEGYDEKEKDVKVIGLFMPGCPHCVQYKPTFETIKREFPSITFKEINDVELASQKYQATSFPTTVIEVNNKIVTKKVGKMSIDQLKAFIQAHVK